jgi:hypothetical protein
LVAGSCSGTAAELAVFMTLIVEALYSLLRDCKAREAVFMIFIAEVLCSSSYQLEPVYHQLCPISELLGLITLFSLNWKAFRSSS